MKETLADAFSGWEGQLLLGNILRHALVSENTWSSETTIEWVMNHWDLYDRTVKVCLIKNVIEECGRKWMLPETRRMWLDFAQWAYEHVDLDLRFAIRSGLKYLKVDFPLLKCVGDDDYDAEMAKRK